MGHCGQQDVWFFLPMGHCGWQNSTPDPVAFAINYIHRDDWDIVVPADSTHFRELLGWKQASPPADYGCYPRLPQSGECFRRAPPERGGVYYTGDYPQRWDVEENYFVGVRAKTLAALLEEPERGGECGATAAGGIEAWDVDDEYLARLDARKDAEATFDRRNRETFDNGPVQLGGFFHQGRFHTYQ